MNTRAHDRIFGIDLLRSVAVLFVLILHGGEALDPMPGMVSSFCEMGWIGVDLFFVLSGFLIGSQIYSGTMGAREFWVRRWSRTLPLYYSVLFVYAVVKPFLLHFPFQGNMPLYLFFGQNFQPISDFGQSWSLCVEEQFYLFIPLLVLGFGLRSPLSVAVIWLVSPAVRAALEYRFGGFSSPMNLPISDYDFYFRFNSLSHLDSLAAGLFLSLTQNTWKAWPVFARRLVGLFGVALAVGTERGFHYTPEGFALVASYSLLSIGFGLAFLGAYDLPRPGAWLRVPVEKVALWSYGAYLWNVLFMRVLAHVHLPIPWYLKLLCFIGVSFALAAVTYHLIEKPGMKLRRFIGRQPAVAQGEARALHQEMQESPANEHTEQRKAG
jgi:peptidoglycan/LPS O-acetylase OafA/YrhL